MGLKFKYKTKDDIPGEQAALYAEREGEWVLDCDGVAEKTKLDEFRSSNAALTKQVEDPMQQIADLVAGYWARTDQGLVISCLKGMFAAANLADNLLAIHSESVAGDSPAVLYIFQSRPVRRLEVFPG